MLMRQIRVYGVCDNGVRASHRRVVKEDDDVKEDADAQVSGRCAGGWLGRCALGEQVGFGDVFTRTRTGEGREESTIYP